MKTRKLNWMGLIVGIGLATVAGRAGAGVEATGGNITESGIYYVHTFTSSGSFVVSSTGVVEVLVVAGGGGGGSGGPGKDSDNGGGGGGAGGFLYSNAVSVNVETIVVTVGAGGIGGSSVGAAAGNGTNSSFLTLNAVGGGQGACAQTVHAAGNGGSGGGASYPETTKGNGTLAQGNDGGSSANVARYPGGSGGGAGAAGSNAIVQYADGLDGGTGVSQSITGSAADYAGGGGSGGGSWWAVGSSGGSGGGGAGGGSGIAGSAGTSNLGGGGGGGGCADVQGTRPAGGAGGSGVVIVRYLKGNVAPTITNAPASNITTNSASLNGTLLWTGTSDTAVFVYYGPTDGGTNAANWANANTTLVAPQSIGAKSVNVTVPSNSEIFYQFAASNTAGVAWGSTLGSPSFYSLGVPAVDNGTGASNVLRISAVLNGNLTAGGTAHVYFRWGTDQFNLAHTNDLGVLVMGSHPSVNLTTLTHGTTYYYQTYAMNASGEALAAVTNFTTLTLPAGTTNWTVDADGNWSNAGIWSVPNGINATPALDVPGTGITTNRTVTLDQNVTIGTLAMNDISSPFNSWTIAQGGAYGLTFDVSGGNAALNVSQGTANAINVPIVLNDNLDVIMAGGSSLNLGGNMVGAAKLTAGGTGTLRLSGSNNFSGGLILGSAVLEYASAASLGTGSIKGGDGGLFQTYHLKNVSGGVVTITNDLECLGGYNHLYVEGDETVLNGLFKMGVNNVLHFGTVTLNNGIGTDTFDIQGSGPGQLNLMAPATGGNVRNINNAVIGLGADGALGTNGVLIFTSSNCGFQALGGNRTITQNFTTPWSSRIVFYGANSNNLIFTGNETGPSPTFRVYGPGTVTVEGTLTGGSGLTKEGDGTLVLSGNNTELAGSINLSGGYIAIGHDNALGSVSSIGLGGWVTRGLMAIGGPRTITCPISWSYATLNIAGAEDLTISGLITGNGSWPVNKYGTGALILSNGANVLAQGIKIYEGSVVAGHADAVGANTITTYSNGMFAVASGVTFIRPVTFNAGSALGGSGTFVKGAEWALPDNFTVRPGLGTNSIGTLTVDTTSGDLTFGDGRTLEIDFTSTTADQLVVSGGALILSGTTDKLVLKGDPALGSYIIASASNVSGTFDVVETTDLQVSGKVSYPGNGTIVFTVAAGGTLISIR